MGFTYKQMAKLARIINFHGIRSQKMMMLEEMAELQKEICKDFRYERSNNAILEELADVLIMIEQMLIVYEISESEIMEMVDKKIDREIERIDSFQVESLEKAFELSVNDGSKKEG